MQTILCYGDSNLWGYIPGSYNNITCLAKRYPKPKRWTGILQNILGETYHVIEEAINGRTTTADETIPGRLYRNGLTYLPFCFESHYPIDIVILLLGTNDFKIQYNRSVADIAQGLQQLITCIKTYGKNLSDATPKILIIAPQPIIKGANLHDQYNETSIEKSKKIASAYQLLAQQEQCEFLDASLLVKSSEIDGVHLDETQCKLLGHAVAEKIKRWL